MEEYVNEFQYVCSCIITFPIAICDKVERFLAGLNEDVKNKILVDAKGDGGSWEKIKCVIHYAVTFDATYAQAAK